MSRSGRLWRLESASGEFVHEFRNMDDELPKVFRFAGRSFELVENVANGVLAVYREVDGDAPTRA